MLVANDDQRICQPGVIPGGLDELLTKPFCYVAPEQIRRGSMLYEVGKIGVPHPDVFDRRSALQPSDESE